MRKCPHCGQSVQPVGATCPLCQQDMRESPAPKGHEASAPQGQPSANELLALAQLWAQKADEELEAVAHSLAEYTDVAQAVIRDELKRRSIEIPDAEAQTEVDPLVYSHPDFHHVESLQGNLEEHGIACEIHQLRAPLTEQLWHGLWLLDETQVGAARRLIETELVAVHQAEVEEGHRSEEEGGVDRHALDDGPSSELPSWICHQCSEDVDGELSQCWNCGYERPSGSVA